MKGKFEIEQQSSNIGIENKILEILQPVHKGCDGDVIIGRSSPLDRGTFKLVCQKCGESVQMTHHNRIQIILALLKGKTTRINDKIIVSPPSGD